MRGQDAQYRLDVGFLDAVNGTKTRLTLPDGGTLDVTIPPGVWHGVVALGPETALLLNLVDKAYAYDAPDHWRLPPDTDQIPYKLV